MEFQKLMEPIQMGHFESIEFKELLELMAEENFLVQLMQALELKEYFVSETGLLER